MTDSQLVSIIVPFYNAETYLSECINSLLSQSYENIEIILVNDGSQDNSESICLDYSRRDSRIYYIYKDNGGAATARNRGVLESRGEFIVFCDVDDSYFPNAIEQLKTAQQKYSADLVAGKITTIYQDIVYQDENELDLSSSLEEMYYGKMLGVSACSKMYRREILIKYPFKEGVIHEDTFTSYKHVYAAKNHLVVLDCPVYLVNQENESISRSHFHPRDLVYRDAMYENLAFLKNENLVKNKNILSAWSFMYVVPMLRIIDKMIQSNHKFDYTFYKEDFSQYSNLFFLSGRISIKHKIKFIVFLTSFQLYKILFNR